MLSLRLSEDSTLLQHTTGPLLHWPAPPPEPPKEETEEERKQKAEQEMFNSWTEEYYESESGRVVRLPSMTSLLQSSTSSRSSSLDPSR